jgi:hypothetical protein
MPMMNQSELAVVFFAENLTPSQVPLYQSLRVLGSKAKTVVITNSEIAEIWACEVDEVIVVKFSSLGLIPKSLRKVQRKFGFIRNFIGALLSIANQRHNHLLATFSMPLVNSRYYYYLEWSQRNPDLFAIYLDSRDMIFQVRPEEIFAGFSDCNSIHLFDEWKFDLRQKNLNTLGQSQINSLWLEQLTINLPQIDRYKLKDYPVINGGGIAGPGFSAIAFFQEVISLFEKSGVSRAFTIDQAALNVIARSIYKGKMIVNRNSEVVYNMLSTSPDFQITFEDEKILVNGRLVPILHMFDRFGAYKNGRLTLNQGSLEILQAQ